MTRIAVETLEKRIVVRLFEERLAIERLGELERKGGFAHADWAIDHDISGITEFRNQ